MAFEPLNIGSYKIENFNQETASITFWVTRIDGYGLSRESDIPKIKAIFKELGRWETAIISMKFLLSELGLTIGTVPNLVHLEIGWGSEVYDVSYPSNNLADGYAVRMSLKKDERHRRKALELDANLKLQEVYEQLKNIPKWEALQRTLMFAQNILITEASSKKNEKTLGEKTTA